MMGWLDLKNYDVDNIKNKPVKFVVTVFIILLFGSLIGALISQSVRYFSGSYTNVFGWEPNGPKQKDTVIASLPAAKNDADTQSTKPAFNLEPFAKKVVKKPVISQTKKESAARKTDSAVKNLANITGDKNHVVQGDNSGINGDVSVINEKKLQESDKVRLLKMINDIKEKNKISGSCFTVRVTTDSNGGKVASEIVEFLKSQGLKYNGGGLAFMQSVLTGVSIGSEKECIAITVGVL